MVCPYNDWKECFKENCPFYREIITKSGDFSAIKERCERAEVEMGHTR